MTAPRPRLALAAVLAGGSVAAVLAQGWRYGWATSLPVLAFAALAALALAGAAWVVIAWWRTRPAFVVALAGILAGGIALAAFASSGGWGPFARCTWNKSELRCVAAAVMRRVQPDDPRSMESALRHAGILP